MKTYKIVDIEKKLGFKLKKDTYTIGVDTASTTGLACIETSEKTLKVTTDIFKLPAVGKDDEKCDKYVEKIEFMLKSIRDYKTRQFGCKKKASKTVLVLENSYLGFNAYTYGQLKVMMGIIFSELYDYFESVKVPFATTARKSVGFKTQLKRGAKREEKKHELIDFVNNIFDTKETSDDICDAIILALVGLKEE